MHYRPLPTMYILPFLCSEFDSMGLYKPMPSKVLAFEPALMQSREIRLHMTKPMQREI